MNNLEFGNINYTVYIIVPALILFFMIIGMSKRNRILDILKLKKYNSVQIIKTILLTLGAIMVVIALLSPQKLLDEDNFFLLPLYDAIQTDSQLKISYKKGDAKILEGEQNKAKRTVRLWLSLSGN